MSDYRFVCETFNSVTELARALKSRSINTAFKGHNLNSEEAGRQNFFGTRTYAKAESLALNGWSEHLAEIRSGVVDCKIDTQTATISRRRPENAVVGFAPNVPNAILGLPHSMITIHQQPQKTKALTLIYNTSITAGWSTSQVLKAGIAICKLINKIELDGVRVRLISEFKSSIDDRKKEIGIVRVIVKDFKDTLDLKRIAFPMAHAGMQRRLGFKWLETAPNITGKWYGSYGASISVYFDSYAKCKEVLTDAKLLNKNEYYLTVPFVYTDCKCEVEKLVKQLNIKY